MRHWRPLDLRRSITEPEYMLRFQLFAELGPKVERAKRQERNSGKY